MSLQRAVRIAAVLLLLIALGLVTTLASAGGLALVRAPIGAIAAKRSVKFVHEPFERNGEHYAGKSWKFAERSRVGETCFTLITMPTLTQPTAPPESPPKLPPEIEWFMFQSWLPYRLQQPMPNEMVNASLFGWPFRSLWYGTVANTGFPQNPPWTRKGYGAHTLGQPTLNARLFPSRILWPGLIANTLVFAAAHGALIYGIVRLIAAVRSRRGLCPHCRYDLRHTPPTSPCPECGTIIQSEARAQALAPQTPAPP